MIVLELILERLFSLVRRVKRRIVSERCHVVIVSGTSDEYISLQWTHYRVSRDTIIIPMTKIYEQPIPRSKFMRPPRKEVCTNVEQEAFERKDPVVISALESSMHTKP